MQDKERDDYLANLGWDQMRRVLDREMPENHRKKAFWWWFLPSVLLLTGALGAAWHFFDRTPLPSKSILVPVAAPAEELRAVPQAARGAYPAGSPEDQLAIHQPGKSQHPEIGSARTTRFLKDSGAPLQRADFPSGTLTPPPSPANSQALNTAPEPAMHSFSSPLLSESRSEMPANLLPGISFTLEVPTPDLEWTFASAPVKPEKQNSGWTVLAEVGTVYSPQTDISRWGGSGGLLIQRSFSSRMGFAAGLNLESFSTGVLTPNANDMKTVESGDPSVGTPNRGSATASLEREVPVRSLGLYLPLQIQIPITRHWKLEGGARLGYLWNHTLLKNISPEQILGTSFSLASSKPPFSGLEGEKLDPAFFKSFDAQLSLDASYQLTADWSAYVGYRHGIVNWVQVRDYSGSSSVLKAGVRYRLGK